MPHGTLLKSYTEYEAPQIIQDILHSSEIDSWAAKPGNHSVWTAEVTASRPHTRARPAGEGREAVGESDLCGWGRQCAAGVAPPCQLGWRTAERRCQDSCRLPCVAGGMYWSSGPCLHNRSPAGAPKLAFPSLSQLLAPSRLLAGSPRK